MDIFETILKRRSVRAYQDKEIFEADLKKILEAARMERLTHVTEIAQVRANIRFIAAHLGSRPAQRQVTVARARAKSVCARSRGGLRIPCHMNAQRTASAF